ncbi:hypothetical protein PIB30_078537, partial [Stylosanthes scabra]|nr:hypothetical protein [Stylosanthes scabra]
MLPRGMHDLVNLRHLDIRGCYSLPEMPKEMSKLKKLNFLNNYIIGEHEDNGIRELGTMDNLHGSFCISKLQNVKNCGEASEAKMGNKKHVNTLNLEWNPILGIDDAQSYRDILDKLQPHQNLKELSIKRYPGETFPDWLGLSRYSKMTKLSLYFCKNCCELPLLGQLPSLQHLKISKFDRLEKIDFEFYNRNNRSFQRETAFKSLETLEIEDMCGLKEWHFPDEFDGFPQLRTLSIERCPVLSGNLPAHLPALEELTILECDKLACSLPRAPKLHQLHVQGSTLYRVRPSAHDVVVFETPLAMSVLECLSYIQSPRIQGIDIKECHSTITISAEYLPASLQYLEIRYCSKLTFSEQIQHKSLTEIYIKLCASLTSFPVQALPSLRKLSISCCLNLVSLPALELAAPCLQELYIEDCPNIECFAEECLPPSLKKLE